MQEINSWLTAADRDTLIGYDESNIFLEKGTYYIGVKCATGFNGQKFYGNFSTPRKK